MTVPDQIQPQAIIAIVASFHCIHRDALTGANGQNVPAWPFNECVWMLRQIAQLDYGQIAALLGNRQERTIAVSLSKVRGRSDDDPAYLRHLQELRAAIFLPQVQRHHDPVALLDTVRAVLAADHLTDKEARVSALAALADRIPMIPPVANLTFIKDV